MHDARNFESSQYVIRILFFGSQQSKNFQVVDFAVLADMFAATTTAFLAEAMMRDSFLNAVYSRLTCTFHEAC